MPAIEVGGPGSGRLELNQVIAWREEGLSYKKIGERVGLSAGTVGRYAHLYLSPELRSTKGKPRAHLGARQRVRELLDLGWADRSGREIAAEVGCSKGLVYDVKREIYGREERERVREGQKCNRCEFYEEPRNPVDESGLCLWCRLQAQGVDLLEFHESGAAVELGFWEAR